MEPKNQSAYALSGAVSAVYILCEKIFAQIPEHSQHGNESFHGKSDGDHRRDMSQSEQGWSDQSGLETRIWSVEGVRRSRLDEDLEVGWAPSAELKSEDLMPGFTA